MIECEFCGHDVDIDDNPEWDFSKALAALEEKYPPVPEGEPFWCCDSCEKLINKQFPDNPAVHEFLFLDVGGQRIENGKV